MPESDAPRGPEGAPARQARRWRESHHGPRLRPDRCSPSGVRARAASPSEAVLLAARKLRSSSFGARSCSPAHASVPVSLAPRYRSASSRPSSSQFRAASVRCRWRLRPCTSSSSQAWSLGQSRSKASCATTTGFATVGRPRSHRERSPPFSSGSRSDQDGYLSSHLRDRSGAASLSRIRLAAVQAGPCARRLPPGERRHPRCPRTGRTPRGRALIPARRSELEQGSREKERAPGCPAAA
jgi:hypothetical protein